MARNNWRERARRIIEAYPALLRKESQLHSCRVTPVYSGLPGGNAMTRTTKDNVSRELCLEDQRKLNSVKHAIATTSRYRNSEDRVKVVDLVYWKKTHTLQGAAQICSYSYDTVQEWNADFIALVDAYYRIFRACTTARKSCKALKMLTLFSVEKSKKTICGICRWCADTFPRLGKSSGGDM